MLKGLFWGVRGVGILLISLLLIRTHCGTPVPENSSSLVRHTLPVLRNLERRNQEGAGAEMQRYFPEGYVFMHALPGLAWIELGLAHPLGHPLRAEARAKAILAVEAMDSPEGTAVFTRSMDPPYGIFHAGWSSHLRVGALWLQPPSERAEAELAALAETCDRIAAAFERSDTPFLQAYPGTAWPVDNVVAISSLPMCGELTGRDYWLVINEWLAQAKEKAVPEYGVLPHGDFSGERHPRATSLTIMTRFLHEVDPDWARLHYDVLREHFWVTLAGFPAVQEYVDGRAQGDVDSGPLVLGASFSATVVGAGSATLYGDQRLAGSVFGLGEVVGLPWGIREKSYGLGLLPVGDAFVVWAKTARPWRQEPKRVEAPIGIPPWWWRLPWEAPGWALVLLLLVGLKMPLKWVVRVWSLRRQDVMLRVRGG